MDTQPSGRIIAVVASVIRRNPESIRVDASLDDLGIDSLDRTNILFELENEFDMDISDEDARRITTIREIIEQVEAYLQHAQRKEA